MRNHRVVIATLALGTAMWVGHAAADGPGDTYGAEKLGTVRFLDRAMNLIQLDDGTELRTADARMLRDIREGMRVKVDYVHDGDRNTLNSIDAIGADATAGATPTTIGGIKNHS
jgi:hypothetical protein